MEKKAYSNGLEAIQDPIVVALIRNQFFSRWRELNQTHRPYNNSGYDLSMRCLSEMHLCDTLTYPQVKELLSKLGISLVQGSVLERDRTTNFHYYGVNTHGSILCFTAGQFIEPFADLRKGDRLDMLQTQAPGLVTRLDEEIALLHGTKEQISQQLGLIYTT